MSDNLLIKYCDKCNYECVRNNDWNRHILTAKHNFLLSNNPICNEFLCKCGKSYKHRSSLFTHKKKCIQKQEETKTETEKILPKLENTIILYESNELNTFTQKDTEELNSFIQNDKDLEMQNETKIDLLTKMLINITSENKEINNLLLEQNKKLTEMALNPNTVNNNKTNNFNINMFLNDTCKNAVSISDFANDIVIQLEELENFGHNGYVEGITSIFKSRLDAMDITERPIHCTDIKRETLHIKDTNEWHSGDDNNERLRNIVKKVAKITYNTLPKWYEKHPTVYDTYNQLYEFQLRMHIAALGHADKDEQNRLDDKIMKNIAKHVYVNKRKPAQLT